MIAILLGTVMAAGGPSLDLRVDGQGLLRFAREGRAVYAKRAHLTVAGGLLVESGVSLLPEIRVPSDVETLTADLEGNVSGSVHGAKVNLGRLVLAAFPLEDGLISEGPFLIAADRPKLCEPGDGTVGVIRTSGEPRVTADAVATKHSVVAPYKAPQPKRIAAGGADITVKADSEVAGDKILLGEIASIEGDPQLCKRLQGLEVGDSPAYGVTRGLDRLSVETRLLQAGIKPDAVTLNVPTSVKVHRRVQTISGEQFLQAALAAAQQKTPGVTYACEQQTLDFSAPIGKVDLVIEGCVVNRQATTVTVAVFVDGKRINSRNVTLKPDGPSQGVSAGQAVKIVLRSGGAIVEVAGKTRTAGLVGQTVTVVADTGAVLTGAVLGTDRVEVKL